MAGIGIALYPMELNTNLDHTNIPHKNTIPRQLRSFSGNQRLLLTLLLLVYLGAVSVLSPVLAAGKQTLPLQFTSTTPETLTTSLQVTVPAGATASTLSVSCFDCDHTDWGSVSINGGARIALWPGPGPSNASGTIRISVPASAWKTGSNTLAFTHSQYVAGRIDALSVSFTSTSGSAILSWALGSEPDLAGYKVYVGTSSGTYNYPGSPFTLGATNTYTISNLPKGQTYFFALSAYDTSGNASGLSAEASTSVY